MPAPAILFVCLGNICRSPMAEGAARAAFAAAGQDVRLDSAGTGDWHIGRPPDARAQAEALRHDVDISALRGRQVDRDDFIISTSFWLPIMKIYEICARSSPPMQRQS